MKAIIPAAGYATRLYPLTLNQPKPLLEVAGKPMIEHVIAKVVEIDDIDEIFIVTNDKFYKNFIEWQKNFKSKIPVKIFNDGTKSNEDRLGSIGDINFVINKAKINDDILIINSDNLFTFSLKDAHKSFTEKNTHTIVLYDVGDLKIASRMGNPEIDEKKKIISFVEKSPKPKSTLASIGIYFYKKEVVKLINQYLREGNSHDKTGEFVAWLYKRRDIYTHIYNNKYKWYDIGNKEILEKARNEFKK